MKRFSIYSLVLIAFAPIACTNINELDPAEESQDGSYITITASTESDSPATKTYLGSPNGGVYPVYWSADDQIGLLSEDGVSVFELVRDGSDLTHATFGGNASKIVRSFPNTLVYPAAYPASTAFASTNGGVLYVGSEVPQIQTLVNNLSGDYRCFENDTYPMAAVETSPSDDYQFYNMAGILRLRIYYSNTATDPTDVARILRVTVRGNNHEILSGPVAMQFDPETGDPLESTVAKDNGKLVGTYGTGGNEMVFIDLSDLQEDPTNHPKWYGLTLPYDANAPLEINLAVIPQTFEHGFTVEIMDASTMGTQKYVSTDGITVERSMIKEMTTIDFTKPNPLEVANCYIASEPGVSTLPAFAFGNRLGTNFDTIDGFDPDNNNVDILWTDIVDDSGNTLNAVTDVEYLKFADGSNYISFRVNEDPNTGEAYRGNTVIALYNENTKEIYWTWHLWLCDTPQDVIIDGKCGSGSFDGVYPDETSYHYEAWATSTNMRIMDRNLGAIHAYPSECDIVDGVTQSWQTYGLYYQDGRKDPFIGGYYNGTYEVSDEQKYQGTKDGDKVFPYLHKYETSPFEEPSSNESRPYKYNGTHLTWTNPYFEQGWRYRNYAITITQSLQNPQVFSFDNAYSRQWTDTGFPDTDSWLDSETYPGKATKHGRTGLRVGEHEAYWNRTKTIFDPCPAGYSVLGKRDGYYIGKAGTSTWYGDDTNGFGLMYNYGGNDIWWPAAGVRAWDGNMAGVGKFGMYFHFDHMDNTHGGHGSAFQLANSSNGTAPTSMTAKYVSTTETPLTNGATPIRCVKSMQEDGTPE